MPNLKSQRRRTSRRLFAEPLEERRLLASDSGAFFGFGSITASFAPDDTRVGYRTSELHAAFDAEFGSGQWQPVIEKAIQTWAREAELNIGFVEDNGAAAGVYGPSQGDSRFGDIRFFGASLGADVWAEAISERTRGAGTWAGDIIFNVDANWRNLNDLEAVALHELGHVFGLEHNNDPKSPMNVHGPSATITPTAEDIAILRSLHGPRDADPTEGDKGNDTIDRAHRIKGNEHDESSPDDFNGSQVWLQFGDLLNSRDVDVFEIHTDAAYTGPMAVNLRTNGLSLAKVQVELLDRNEVVLGRKSIATALGGETTLTLDRVAAGAKYFIRVSATSDAFWSQGDYAVAVGQPNILSADRTALAQWGNMVHRWYFDSRGAERGFSYHLQNSGADGYSEDDNHADDNHVTARRLLPALSSTARTVYSTVGTVSDLVDVDYLQFTTPKKIDVGTKLLVNVESLTQRKLVPRISVFDTNNVELQAELLSVGYGATQLLISNVKADTRYLVRLDSTGVDAVHRTGNYSVNLELSTTLTSNDLFAAGTITEETTTIRQTLYLAIPQVITFSLESSPVSGSVAEETQAIFQLFNSQRQLIHNIVAPLGTMRSLPGVLLDAGEHYLQISVVSKEATQPAVNVRLSGTRPTDPIGPLFTPVDSEPLYICDVGGDFCYPDGTVSTTPSHVGPSPLMPLPPPPLAPLPPAPDEFFWDNDLIFGTNFGNFNDASGDGIVSALDALLVINYINTNGSGTFPTQFFGYIDTNADKIISPMDALLIINELNR